VQQAMCATLADGVTAFDAASQRAQDELQRRLRVFRAKLLALPRCALSARLTPPVAACGTAGRGGGGGGQTEGSEPRQRFNEVTKLKYKMK
jgi:hypothetical protein